MLITKLHYLLRQAMRNFKCRTEKDTTALDVTERAAKQDWQVHRREILFVH